MNEKNYHTLAEGYVCDMLSKLQEKHELVITPGRYNKIVLEVEQLLSDSKLMESTS